MSYDIFFVRRDPGQTFEDALDGPRGLLRGRRPRAADRRRPRAVGRHAAAGPRESSGRRRGIDEEDDETRELTDPGTGIGLTFFQGEFEIHVPDNRPGSDDLELMATVYELARAVEDVTGLEGYDPQLGEPVSDTSDTLADPAALGRRRRRRRRRLRRRSGGPAGATRSGTTEHAAAHGGGAVAAGGSSGSGEGPRRRRRRPGARARPRAARRPGRHRGRRRAGQRRHRRRGRDPAARRRATRPTVADLAFAARRSTWSSSAPRCRWSPAPPTPSGPRGIDCFGPVRRGGRGSRGPRRSPRRSWPAAGRADRAGLGRAAHRTRRPPPWTSSARRTS